MIAELLQRRGAYFDLIVVALLLATGVNLISQTIGDRLASWQAAGFGAFAILSAFAILFWIRIGNHNVDRTFDGLVVYSTETRRLVSISRYDISESLARYVASLFAENKATETLWDAAPLASKLESGLDPSTGRLRIKPTDAISLVREGIEYFALERLSTHLNDYFNAPTFRDDLLRHFSREDVPSILFKNRFLDTFSRPMRERTAFVSDALEESSDRTVSSMKSDGEYYQRFDLVLPKGATLVRGSDGALEIRTPKFRLSINVQFDGFGSILPSEFALLYLRIDDSPFTDPLRVFRASVRIAVKFALLAPLTRTGWKYHNWLDAFVESLSNKVSFSEFKARIGWDTARTLFHLLNPTFLEETRTRQAYELAARLGLPMQMESPDEEKDQET